jgi:hypothetical protein
MGRASTISMGARRSCDTRILREADCGFRRMRPLVAAGATASATAVVRIAVFYQDSGQADQIEVHGLGAGGGEADAEGGALPGGSATGRMGWTLRCRWSRGPGADFLCQDRSAAADLRDHGVELVAARIESAVSGIVPKPDDLGDGGIVVGQLHGGNVAVGAVDHDPGTALPDPVFGFVAGEGVIEAQGPAYDEAAVGDVVDLAGGPFLDLVVNDEGPHVEGFLLRASAGGIRSDPVGNALACADADGMGLGTASGEEWQGNKEEEDRQGRGTHLVPEGSAGSKDVVLPEGGRAQEGYGRVLWSG